MLEGDLPAAEAAELETHLAACDECRGAAGMYGAGIELLREAHREPIAEAHYAAVRARVLAELRQERRPVWRWIWVGGLAAVAVAAVFDAVADAGAYAGADRNGSHSPGSAAHRSAEAGGAGAGCASPSSGGARHGFRAQKAAVGAVGGQAAHRRPERGHLLDRRLKRRWR